MLDRIIVACVAVASLTTGAVYGYEYVKHLGYEEAQTEFAEASRVATKAHKDEIAKLNKMHETINKGTVASYETKLSDLDRKYRTVGGLRVSKTVCRSNGASPATESTARDYETESIRLPQDVEQGLYDIVRKADEVNAQLSACQGWIRANKMD